MKGSELMKHMLKESQIGANGGSVRCNKCGMTYWGVADCKAHIRRTHGHGAYTWYQWGPYNRYTRAWEHGGWKRCGSV